MPTDSASASTIAKVPPTETYPFLVVTNLNGFSPDVETTVPLGINSVLSVGESSVKKTLPVAFAPCFLVTPLSAQ